MSTSTQPTETKTVSMTAIVDRSASMRGYKKEAIEGLIRIIEEQGDALTHLRLVMFSTTCETVFDSAVDPHPEGQFMTKSKLEEFLVTDGCTAMYDAMNIGLRQAQEDTADINMVLFLTDGHENSSVETTFEQIKTQIQTARKNDIVIISLGVSKYDATKLGLDTDQCIEFSNTKQGMTSVMRAASQLMRSYSNEDEEGRRFTEEQRMSSSQSPLTRVMRTSHAHPRTSMGTSMMGESMMGESMMDFDSVDNRSMHSQLSSSPV